MTTVSKVSAHIQLLDSIKLQHPFFLYNHDWVLKIIFLKIYFLGFKKLQYDQVVVWNVQFIGMVVKTPSKEIYHLEIKILILIEFKIKLAEANNEEDENKDFTSL